MAISKDTLELKPIYPVTERLDSIKHLNLKLEDHFKAKSVTDLNLTRQLVSFQANKGKENYRWYKYKEAFSSTLVEYLINRFEVKPGKLLDPFAGVGTALFAASSMGFDCDGIELLPVGREVITNRIVLEQEVISEDIRTLKEWVSKRPWNLTQNKLDLGTFKITKGAYPEKTLRSIEQYLDALEKESPKIRKILRFALLCILESVSYTRKDGQYLRWDHRSDRGRGKTPFDKGIIADFDTAICNKIEEILSDIQYENKQGNLFSNASMLGKIKTYSGSSLEIMPKMHANTYDLIITSPPYCNRYDYTRTYALELALFGLTERDLVSLRQELLSCTVENRAKDLNAINSAWANAIQVVDNQKLLQEILSYLEEEKMRGNLNNDGIPRMVRGYFYELACIIFECARVIKKNGLFFMVNDNVRYASVSIPVDLILSDIAEKLGFRIENILLLPIEKGNSSQQMGEYGRDGLRKCVYVWRKN